MQPHIGQQKAEAIPETGWVAALKRILNSLQAIVSREFSRLRRAGTCSRDFLDFIDSLEERAAKEMANYGLQKLSIRGPPPKEDIVLGWFAIDNIVIELGLRGINKCGVLEELTAGKPPRVYARVYAEGRVAFILEASLEEEHMDTVEAGYII
ncbi:hypothetical protein [Hyperthermus butylicus]|uniref:Uncharacterized protein n=1 Tax=Hyperthermus butylicus (strain DSM 5456 / JCM 9403 / PLM1-5) TaxID=415426 RepID=A2BK40_HYPBU|nr:hypothetical protein [Hyperthermus butylicus]ABM80351.1 hypothetical protein Hbut_0489 [Hyperthermus butylicus DSM 5456]